MNTYIWAIAIFASECARLQECGDKMEGLMLNHIDEQIPDTWPKMLRNWSDESLLLADSYMEDANRGRERGKRGKQRGRSNVGIGVSGGGSGRWVGRFIIDRRREAGGNGRHGDSNIYDNLSTESESSSGDSLVSSDISVGGDEQLNKSEITLAQKRKLALCLSRRIYRDEGKSLTKKSKVPETSSTLESCDATVQDDAGST